ncbi:MAG: bifunctional glutamate N-acetyltransferase/amino-acid acetyltransferase ArgJ [Candidatus Latescibacteria bacterium]|jgi:glutamate N-acetyltransferase/amino-acid N-acetyltransferase|nr:bifunctional glutamate N-acetyltransferase/amino-acid acetyltransferase ArgJ [Candidatus Latescibacterota bacterium]
MKPVEGDLLAPKGFTAGTISCGINSLEGSRKDLIVINAGTSVSAAAVFTTNKVQAAPVLLSKQHVQTGMAQAIVVNSGNANACNGETGMRDAREMSRLVADGLGIPSEQILIASTGVIGRPMPMDVIRGGIQKAIARLDPGTDQDSAEAIMTTDTVPKFSAVRCDISGKTATIGGIAKGSGMICPNMATMIAVLTTDVAIAPGALKAALNAAVGKSFNCITIDGDMSTNDTVFLLANGTSGHPTITMPSGTDYKSFVKALEFICTDLAKKIARDGEGATKLVEIQVNGARSDEDARTIGMSVANSALVKTAIYGHDPNWGRIICAVGYADADSDPDTIDLFLCGHQLTKDGQGLPLDEPMMRKALESNEISVVVDLKMDKGKARIWTCDMSHEYVTINAEYTT